MNELLTAKDVEVKVFKKSRFGGYSVPEVEDFLNQVADDLEAYAIQLDEKDARIQELEAYVKKQEAMTDAIKDALIQARKAAKDMEEQAQSQKDKIITEAQAEASRIISEADSKVKEITDDAQRKSTEIVSEARLSAAEIVQTSRDKKTLAEQSIAGIEQELSARRQEAENEAQDILSAARADSRRMLIDAQNEVTQCQEQLQFLNLRKQQFLKDTVSLLLDFGKIIDNAQEDINEELNTTANDSEIFSEPEGSKSTLNADTKDEA